MLLSLAVLLLLATLAGQHNLHGSGSPHMLVKPSGFPYSPWALSTSYVCQPLSSTSFKTFMYHYFDSILDINIKWQHIVISVVVSQQILQTHPHPRCPLALFSNDTVCVVVVSYKGEKIFNQSCSKPHMLELPEFIVELLLSWHSRMERSRERRKEGKES